MNKKCENLNGESYVDSEGKSYAKIKTIWGLFNWAKVHVNSDMNELVDMLKEESLLATYGTEQLKELTSEFVVEVPFPLGDMHKVVDRFSTYLDGIKK